MTWHINGPLTTGLLDSTIVAKGLINPRGLQSLDDGSILVVEAGSGAPQPPGSGRVVKLGLNDSKNGPKYIQKETLLAEQQSMNMLKMMQRDEIMGLADVAHGDHQILVSLTDYVGGSKVMRVSPLPVCTVFNSRGNLNSIVYHPVQKAWYGIKPDANVVVEFSAIGEEGEERIVANLADLADGQDAVPVCVIYEPQTQSLLVSLFSGELGVDPAKKGIDFDKTAGQVVRVDINSGLVTPVLTGLTAPTGIALSDDGLLHVLELCSDFLQPLTADDALEQCLHGGFKRFSGRLLAVDLTNGHATVLANQLDTPSNIEITDKCILISEGMGVPGRPIPDVNGKSQPLKGYIRQLMLS
jgi:hypothetical protein